MWLLLRGSLLLLLLDMHSLFPLRLFLEPSPQAPMPEDLKAILRILEPEVDWTALLAKSKKKVCYFSMGFRSKAGMGSGGSRAHSTQVLQLTCPDEAGPGMLVSFS